MDEVKECQDLGKLHEWRYNDILKMDVCKVCKKRQAVIMVKDTSHTQNLKFK